MVNVTTKITKYAVAVIFMAILLPTVAHSQNNTPDTTTVSFKPIFNIYERLRAKSEDGSEIVIQQDPRVESLLKQHFDKGGPGKTKGCRIRVLRDNSQNGRTRAESLEYSIKNNYPGVPVYPNYDAPYWYVDVGDFRTRDEAEKMKKEIKNQYPSASIIDVLINFPPL